VTHGPSQPVAGAEVAITGRPDDGWPVQGRTDDAGVALARHFPTDRAFAKLLVDADGCDVYTCVVDLATQVVAAQDLVDRGPYVWTVIALAPADVDRVA